MSKVLKIAAGLVSLIVLAVGAILLFVDVNQYRGTIQSQLEQSLGRKVSLGELKLKLLPIAIRVSDVAIGDDPEFSQADFLKAKEIEVRVGLLPLLKKEVRVDKLLIREPAVELIRKKGIWNFSSLGSKTKQPSGSDSGGDLSLEELTLIDGIVAVTDKERAVYEDIDLTVRHLSPGTPFTAEVTMRFPQKIQLVASLGGKYDKASQTLDLSTLGLKLGSFQMTGSGKIVTATAPAQLNLDINVPGAAIAELTRLAAAVGAGFKQDMKVDGTIEAKIHVSGPADKPQLTGNLNATKVEVTGAGWKQPVRTADIKVQLTPTTITTSPFEVESGGTRLKAAVNVTGYATDAPQLTASASTQGARIEELLKIAAAYGMNAAHEIQGSGAISLDVKISGPLSDLTYSGSGSLDDASIQPATLKKPIAVKTARIRFEEDSAVLENLACSLGGSNLRGTMKVRKFSAPELEFQADVDSVDVAALQGLIVTPAPAAAPPPQTDKKKRAVVAAKPPDKPLEKIKGKGTLSVGKIQQGTVTLTKVHSDVSIDKGILRMDPLTADLFGGAQRGTIQVDMRPDIPAVVIATKFDKVDANQLLSSTSSVKNFVYGLLQADGDLKIAPRPGEDIARTLNGTIGLKLSNGKLAGVSIVNELSKVAKFLGYSEQSQLVTNILSLSGTMKFDNGVGTTTDLKMAFDGGTLTAAGTLGLVDQQLKMKVTSVLSKEISDKFGGNRIGGFMTTALANPRGEIVIPCLVSGSTTRPIFTPDGAEFAKLKVQNIVPTAGSILNAITKGGQQEGGATGAAGVGGALLDMLGGRKRPETKK